MTRTKLCDRVLPDYTRGEELMNMITHIVGGALGVVVLLSCVIRAALRDNYFGILSCTIYGTTFITMFTISSVYHGLAPGMSKKVMQVIDHCTIYLLIGGTYTPILFCAIRPLSPVWAWGIFAAVWGCAITAAVFTAIDLKKYEKLSMACYIGAGWCIILAAKITIEAIGPAGFGWLLAGGIIYTIGGIIYALKLPIFNEKHKYFGSHEIFHLFVMGGSVCHFIVMYVFVAGMPLSIL